MAFDTIKIMELPSATQVVEEDYLVVEQPDKTRKAAVSQVISDLDLANKGDLAADGGASLIGTSDGTDVQKSLDSSCANERELWRRALHDLGLTLVEGSFEDGATLNYVTDAIWHIAGAQCFTWGDTFPKTVPAKSTPSTTGDVSTSAWVTVGGLSLLDEVTGIKNEAVEAKDRAEDARDEVQAYVLQASELGNLYASVSEGLAETTDGQYFQVPQGSGSSVAFKVYKNDAGVAQEVAAVPGIGAITNTVRVYESLEIAQADADAGNISVGSTAYYRSPDDGVLAVEVINNSGTLQPTGRKIPSQAAISTLGSELNEINATVIRNLDVELLDGRKIVIALTDENGSSNLFIDDRGATYLGGVVHDTSEVVYDPQILQVRTDSEGKPIERVFKTGHVLSGLGYAPAVPEAVYQLNPIGIYLADNVTLNPDAPAIRAVQLKDINDYNLGLIEFALNSLVDNDYCSGAAAAEWLYDWAMRRSLILASTTGTSGLFERQWRVANIAISYMLVKGSIPVPLRAEILSWITEVGTAMIADFDSKYGATRNNNHAYWVAAALYACYVVTDNTDFRDFALTIYDQAMGRIQANGTISSEMDRASRVLYYHNFAIEPLIMICELAIRKGEDVYGRNSKLFSMIETTIHGIVDPAWFKTNAGLTYDQEAITGLGWCAFVALRYPEIDQGRLNSDLSVYVDQFFMGKTYLLAQSWVK